MMKLTTDTFSLNTNGVKATSQTNKEDPDSALQSQFIVFCDVVSQEEEERPHEENTALKALIEQWIQEHLQSQGLDNLNETKVNASLEYAHHRLIQFNETSSQKLAVSAVVIATVEQLTDPGEKELLIAGVGDSRVYQIFPERLELVFADPKNPDMWHEATVTERIENLNNAIGVGSDISVLCHRLPLSKLQNFTVASYGLCAQSTDTEILGMGLRPHDEHAGPENVLSHKTLKGHSIHIKTLSIAKEEPAETTNAPMMQMPEEMDLMEETPNQQKQKAVRMALTAGVCSLAVLMGIQMFKSDGTKAKPLPPATAQIEEVGAPASSLAAATERLQALCTENEELYLSIEDMKSNLADKDRVIEDLKEQLTTFATAEATTTQPSKYMEDLKDRNDIINRLNVSNTNLRSEVANKDKKISYLEKTVATLEEVIDNLDNAQDTESVKLQKDLATLQEKASSERDELLRVIQQIETREQALADELKQKEKRIASLTQDNESQKTTLKSAEERLNLSSVIEERNSRLQKENATLTENLTVTKSETETMLRKLRELRNEKTEMAEELKIAQMNLEQLKHEIEDYQAQNKQLDELSTVLTERNQTNRDLVSRIDDLNNENQKLKDQLTQADEIATLLEQEKQKGSSLAARIEALSGDNQKLNREKVDLLAMISGLEEYQSKYAQEHKMRLEKEAAFKQLAQNLREQKLMLNQIKKSRDTIARDLERSRQDFSRLRTQQQFAGNTPAARTPAPARVAPAPVQPVNSVVQTGLAELPTVQQIIHKVERGDTLSGISLKYYGTTSRWQDILEANRSVIENEKNVRVGVNLVIP